MKRTKAAAEQTRQDIIRAALSLFSRNGYSHTTLARIGAEAGYSRGPIYWHFRNKDDLYHEVLRYSQEPLEQLVEEASGHTGDPTKAIDTFVRHWLNLLVEDDWFRQSFEILLNKTELTDAMAVTLAREKALTVSVVNCLESLVAEGQNKKLVSTTQEPKNLALLIYSTLMGITQSWLFAPDLFNLDEKRDFFVDRIQQLLKFT